MKFVFGENVHILIQKNITLGLQEVGRMPEHFVDDLCECLKFVCKEAPSILVSLSAISFMRQLN